MTTPHKLYRHITGLRGDCGENAATLAIAAVLSPSPHYPDAGRIIVGAPETSEVEIAAWSSGPEAAVRIAETLLEAVADVDAAIDAAPPLAFRYRVSALGATPVPPAAYEFSNGRCDCCCKPIDLGTRVLAYWESTPTGVRVAILHSDPCVADDREIDIAFQSGGSAPARARIRARVIGLWAMHRIRPDDVEHDGRHPLDFGVTHVPSGLRILRAFTRREAWLLVQRLGAQCSGAEYREFPAPVDAEPYEAARQIVLSVIAERSPAEASEEVDRG